MFTLVTKSLAGRSAIAPRLVSGTQNTFFTYTNELSHPIPDRKAKIVKVEEAVSVIKSCKFQIRNPK